MIAMKSAKACSGLLAGVLVMAAGAPEAQAGCKSFSFSFGWGSAPYVVAPAPVVVAPAPVVMAPAPVVVAPAPVVLRSVPVYYPPVIVHHAPVYRRSFGFACYGGRSHGPSHGRGHYGHHR